MLAGDDLQEYYSSVVHPFKCPECDSRYSKLSGLLQHVESEVCGQTMDYGAMRQLMRYMNSQYR